MIVVFVLAYFSNVRHVMNKAAKPLLLTNIFKAEPLYKDLLSESYVTDVAWALPEWRRIHLLKVW